MGLIQQLLEKAEQGSTNSRWKKNKFHPVLLKIQSLCAYVCCKEMSLSSEPECPSAFSNSLHSPKGQPGRADPGMIIRTYREFCSCACVVGYQIILSTKETNSRSIIFGFISDAFLVSIFSLTVHRALMLYHAHKPFKTLNFTFLHRSIGME